MAYKNLEKKNEWFLRNKDKIKEYRKPLGPWNWLEKGTKDTIIKI